jgi:hypothetical protein
MDYNNISKLKGEKLLTEVEKWFSDAVYWDKDWRDNAKIWYDYYHGRQWTSDEIAALEERGQAVTTYNHIKPSIDSVIGSERQNRPKITMAGRTLDDGRLAQAKTSLYNYITYNSKTDDELDKMVRDAFVTGRGWMHIYPETIEVENTRDKMGQEGKVHESKEEVVELMHTFVDYRDMFLDSYSKADDLGDARYVHYAKYTDSDIIKTKFPKFKEDSQPSQSVIAAGIIGFESSSDDEIWYFQGNRNRPRLITTWYKDEKGDISMVIWVKGQILYSQTKPYELNKYPFVQFTVERDLDNKPYGLVKGMVSAQDEVNKRHSKALHYLNAKQVLAEEDAFVDWNQAEKTLAKPDGITKLVDGALATGKVHIIDNTQLATVHIQMMEIAKNNILYSAGLNPSFVGQASQYESAKKANISIAQAQNSIVPILNKLRIARYEIAYITMKLVPEFYIDERVIRILEPTGEYSFMPLNAMRLLDDDTIGRINDMSNDDVDIIIEDAPRGLNEKEEQFAQLMQIQGQTARPIPMEILLRYSSIKDKYQLAADLEQYYKLEAQLQQSQQIIEQLQQQIQQLGGQTKVLENNLVQERTARAVEKEVNKQKGGMYGL